MTGRQRGPGDHGAEPRPGWPKASEWYVITFSDADDAGGEITAFVRRFQTLWEASGEPDWAAVCCPCEYGSGAVELFITPGAIICAGGLCRSYGAQPCRELPEKLLTLAGSERGCAAHSRYRRNDTGAAGVG
jgi:hypothetical protein